MKAFRKAQDLSYKTLLTIFFFILAVVLLLAFNKSRKAVAAWWDDTWRYRTALTINNSGAGQSNKKVKFDIDTGTLYTAGKIQIDCDDSRFTDANGNLLDYYLDSANGACNTNSTDYYVLVPTINSGATVIYHYYGNSSATKGSKNAQFSQDTFSPTSTSTATEEQSPAPVAYWKFDEGSGTTVNDSGQGRVTGTLGTGAAAPTWKTEEMCVSGKCLYLNGNNSISTANSTLLDQTGPITVSLWINPTTTTGRISLLNRSSFTADNGYSLELHSGNPAVLINNGRTASDTQKCNQTVSVNRFTHLMWTRDGSNNNKLFINGTECTYSSTISNVQTTASTTLSIGSKLNKHNVAPYMDYSNRTYNSPYTASSWGGDAATITYYGSDGYNDLPYKILDKTTGGTGGSYLDDNGSMTIENNKTYVISAWMKANQTANNISAHILNINRTADNTYRTGGTYNLTTDWQRYSWVYSAGADHAGSYKSRHIIYVDTGLPLDIYWTGFTVEDVTGTSQTVPNSDFTGFLDDVKIYPYARSAAQIKADYNARGTQKGVSLRTQGDSLQEGLSNGLVGYWNFDNGSGTTAPDLSGNSNTATLGTGSSAPGWVAGNYGVGLSFDGNDYANAGSGSVLDLTSSFTLSAWVNPSSASEDGYIITRFAAGSVGYAFQWWGSGNTLRLFSTSVLYSESDAVCTESSAWVHVLVTFSGGNVNFYKNGVRIGSASGVAMSSAPALSNYIGNRESGSASNHFFSGLIDEVRIYNRALSPLEVRQLYEWAPGPVGYWKFDDGSGNTVSDRSGNGNNGSWAGTGTHWTTGKYGKAGYFNGTNDRTEAGSSNTFTITQAGTVSLWAKPSAGDASLDMVFSKGGPDWATLDYVVFWNNNRFYGSIANGTSSLNTNGPKTSVLSNNNWYYVTFTWDTVSDTASLYLNGVLSQTVSTALVPRSTQTGIAIGRDLNYNDYYFPGLIDDVKIYNYARTQKQIVEDMNAGHPAPGSPVGSAVAHYEFDEGYGTTTNNSGFGGLGLLGTLGTGSSSPTWTNNGKFGKALSFDGSNDYVDFGSNSSLRPTSGISFGAWIKWNQFYSDSAGHAVISYSNSATNGFMLYQGTGSAPYNVVTTFVDTSSGLAALVSNKLLNTGQWYHVFATYDGSTLKLYIDGFLDESTSKSGTIDWTSISTNLYAGSTYTSTGAKFNGSIDEVKIYNYALTEDEVKLDYNRGAALVLGSLSSGTGNTAPATAASQEYCIPGDTASCSPPVGRWDFNEGVGTSAFDTSENGNNGGFGAGTAAPTWTTGKVGKGLKFDGSNDYVDAGNGASLIAAFPTMTVEAWIYITGGQNTYRAIVSATTTTHFHFQIDTDNKLQIYFYGPNKQPFSTTLFDSTNYNKWFHVVGVWDGTYGRIYVNGIQEGITTAGSGSVNAATSNIFIGQGYDSGRKFNGLIDQVRIYNYARSAQQISWDYNRGAPVAHYKFDECEGSVAHDSAGVAGGGGFAGNNGTITIGGTGTQTTLGTCSVGTGSTAAWGNGSVGKYNSSLNFDGTDDYVNIGGNETLYDNNAITISVWAKINSIAGTHEPFVTRSTNPYFGGYTDKVLFQIGGTVYSASGLENYVGEWTHFVVVYDDNAGSNNARIYINGKLDKQETESWTLTNVDDDIYIGRWGSKYLNGQIDEVKIFNYALTATQVKTLYNDGAIRFGPVTGSP